MFSNNEKAMLPILFTLATTAVQYECGEIRTNFQAGCCGNSDDTVITMDPGPKVHSISEVSLQNHKTHTFSNASQVRDTPITIGDALYPMISLFNTSVLFDTGSSTLSMCFANVTSLRAPLRKPHCMYCTGYGNGTYGFTTPVRIGNISVNTLVGTDVNFGVLMDSEIVGGETFCGWSGGIFGVAYNLLNKCSSSCDGLQPNGSSTVLWSSFLDTLHQNQISSFGVGAHESSYVMWTGSKLNLARSINFTLSKAGLWYSIEDVTGVLHGPNGTVVLDQRFFMLDTGTPYTGEVGNTNLTLTSKVTSKANEQTITFTGFDENYSSSFMCTSISDSCIIGWPAIRQYDVQWYPFSFTVHFQDRNE